jgi:SAM-dependent methyltransferase
MARERRLAFGEVAELYDRVRPSYPSALVDDVIERADMGRQGRALEVGAGTGKATVEFAARGVSVLALEPSPEMAAIAKRNCAPYELVTIEQTDLEHFSPDGRSFGLLFSAQAWHWVLPEVRYVKARAALASGGVLALFWNRRIWRDSPLRAELLGAYRSAAPDFDADPGPMHPGSEARPERWGRYERELEAAAGFARTETRSYDWSTEYPADQYLQLLDTHSDHIILPDSQRRALHAAVRGILERQGGSISVRYVTELCLARAV